MIYIRLTDDREFEFYKIEKPEGKFILCYWYAGNILSIVYLYVSDIEYMMVYV